MMNMSQVAHFIVAGLPLICLGNDKPAQKEHLGYASNWKDEVDYLACQQCRHGIDQPAEKVKQK